MNPARPHRKLGRFAALLGITALIVTTAAAKGGKTTGSPQCGASPNPVTNGSWYSLVGSSFPAAMGVTVYVADAVSTSTYKGLVAGNGTFTIPAQASFTSTGTKTMYVDKTGDRKFATWCQAQFNVQ